MGGAPSDAGEREAPIEGLAGIERVVALMSWLELLLFLCRPSEFNFAEACFSCTGGGRLEPSVTNLILQKVSTSIKGDDNLFDDSNDKYLPLILLILLM